MRFRPIILCCAAAALLAGWAGCGGDSGGLPVETDEPLYREGQRLEKEGRNTEALAAYLRLIIQRADDAPESHLEAGLIELQELKNPIAAIYHFDRYRELKPHSPLDARVVEQIQRARRDFAATLPAQNWESAGGAADASDRIAQLEAENERLKAELATLRGSAMVNPPRAAAGDSPVTFGAEGAAGGGGEGGGAGGEASPALIPITPAAVAPAAVAQAEPSAHGDHALHPQSGRTHVVAAHDTLYSLSRRYYGTASKWRQILAANRDKLSGDRPSLVVGEVLKIP